MRMDFLKMMGRLFRRYELSEVFTPSTSASLSYIERTSLERSLDGLFCQPGKQIFLYGYSRSGKTTLWTNYAEKNKIKCIKTICAEGNTFEDILYSGFSQMNLMTPSVVKMNDGGRISGGLGGAKPGFLSSVDLHVERSSSRDTLLTPLIKPQLNPQTLAEAMGKGGYVWVIDDFHKVDRETKKLLSNMLKLFADVSTEYPKSKIICLGAVDNIEEILEDTPDLRSRVSHIHVNMMDDTQIRELVTIGCALLNVSMDKELVDMIVDLSMRDAGVAHQLCYILCHNEGIKKTRLVKAQIGVNKLAGALKEYVQQNDTMLNSKIKYVWGNPVRKDIAVAILSSNKELLSRAVILQRVKQIDPDLEEADIVRELGNMSSDKEDVLRFSSTKNKYGFKDKIFRTYLEMVLKTDETRSQVSHILTSMNLYVKKSTNDDDSVLWASLIESLIALKEKYGLSDEDDQEE